jgi:hypothetical protein
MSRLAEFRALEQKLAAQLAELESLKNDDGLKREIEFEKKLRVNRPWFPRHSPSSENSVSHTLLETAA